MSPSHRHLLVARWLAGWLACWLACTLAVAGLLAWLAGLLACWLSYSATSLGCRRRAVWCAVCEGNEDMLSTLRDPRTQPHKTTTIFDE